MYEIQHHPSVPKVALLSRRDRIVRQLNAERVTPLAYEPPFVANPRCLSGEEFLFAEAWWRGRGFTR